MRCTQIAFFILSLAILTSSVFAATEEEIEKTAREYKGYDELIKNISTVEYHNGTYYWVEYSRNLAYSSSVVLDENLSPVKDDWDIKVFTVAEVLNKNYPPQSAEEWKNFADYFNSISGYFNQSSNSSQQASDSNEIAAVLYDCSSHLNNSIKSYSPQDAEIYLSSEVKAIKLMETAHANYIRAKADGVVNMDDYDNSLVNIRQILVANENNLDKASTQLNRYSQSKIMSPNDKQNAEILLTAAGALVMLAVYYLRSKRSNSSKQSPPPQA